KEDKLPWRVYHDSYYFALRFVLYRLQKDGPMPIHGKLFMGLYRSVGISETDLVFSFCPSFSIPGA
ncbi:hypothetical protein, partial [Clostridium sp. MCC353]|uniref:hypothetical protein n=1 Tax=Clostridium sp. MCC353 TaxID=2592646 RepID=UPI001C01A8C0